MRIRIAAVACGIVLAVIGVPAAPAAAGTGTTCENLYVAGQPQPGDEYVIARACITWNDAPDGDKWTLTEQRIWNPPGGVNYSFLSSLYDNTGHHQKGTRVSSGESIVSSVTVVGGSTAKFSVLAWNYSDVPFCIYLIPRGSNIEHHEC